jgi:hypothetical protein
LKKPLKTTSNPDSRVSRSAFELAVVKDVERGLDLLPDTPDGKPRTIDGLRKDLKVSLIEKNPSRPKILGRVCR